MTPWLCFKAKAAQRCPLRLRNNRFAMIARRPLPSNHDHFVALRHWALWLNHVISHSEKTANLFALDQRDFSLRFEAPESTVIEIGEAQKAASDLGIDTMRRSISTAQIVLHSCCIAGS
jgi:hypothetical protein